MKDHSKIADYLRELGLYFTQDRSKEHVCITGGPRFTETPAPFWGDGKPVRVYEDGFSLWEDRDGTMTAGLANRRGTLGIHIEGVPVDEALEFLRRRYKP